MDDRVPIEAESETDSAPRVRLLTTANPDRAEVWAHALDAAGIDVLVEISDAQVAQPGSSPLIGVLGARPLEFVHVLTVRPEDRQPALAALVDAGWDGHEGMGLRSAPSVRGMLIAALLALSGIAAFVLLRAATS